VEWSQSGRLANSNHRKKDEPTTGMGDFAFNDLQAESTASSSSWLRSNRTGGVEKKLHAEVEQLQTTYPEAKLELWCEDEHRLGLKPILRRVYVPEGVSPLAQVNWRFEWLWLYGFVHPRTGESYYWILP
jgi:hypothetical protein